MMIARNKIEIWQGSELSMNRSEPKSAARRATIHWSFDGWATANDLVTRDAGFGCWFADLPSDRLKPGGRIIFTFLWQEGWEGKDFQVEIAASNQPQTTR